MAPYSKVEWWAVRSRASLHTAPVLPGGVYRRRRPEEVRVVSTHLEEGNSVRKAWGPPKIGPLK